MGRIIHYTLRVTHNTLFEGCLEMEKKNNK